MTDLSSERLLLLINHIFLPPKLPGSGEDEWNIDIDLLKALNRHMKSYVRTANRNWSYDSELISALHTAGRTISQHLQLRSAKFTTEKITEEISNMRSGDVLVMHLRAQNACLILRCQADAMIFESFEVSPPNEKIMRTSGRLVCSFPGAIISLPLGTARNPDFLGPLCHFLERMDVEELEQALPVSEKAGNKMVESRDTTHPMFITEVLTGILRGVGSPVENSETRIRKCYRDDITWKSAKLPWRRCPLWLVLKVGLQTTLRDKSVYKSVMLHFMVEFLKEAVEHNLGSDILSVMNSKISRRYLKMLDRRLPVPTFLEEHILEIGGDCKRLLEQRWEKIQSKLKVQVAFNLEGLDIDKDIKMSLKNSDAYIQSVINRGSKDTPATSFTPSEADRISTSEYSIPFLSTDVRYKSDKYLLLQDFEKWVEFNISTWSKRNFAQKSSCGILQRAIQNYDSIARPLYQSSPTNWSILVLTLAEMWVALDEMLIHFHPLLELYHPELTTPALEPLVLRKRTDMERLHRVEAYIKKRVAVSDDNRPRILSDEISTNSFSVEYARSSSIHRELLEKIKKDADKAKSQKEEEHERISHEHSKLMDEAEQLKHEWGSRKDQKGGLTRFHDPDCRKCELEKEAKSKTIKLHEWPLPMDDIKASATIFELDCPEEFAIWRDTTYWMLVDIFGAVPRKKNSWYTEMDIRSYSELKEYFSERKQRLTLQSTTKSMLISHYNGLRFPVDIAKVCVNNGMRWCLYDMDESRYVEKTVEESSEIGIPYKRYTFQMSPGGPYTHLANSLGTATFTSNDVLAAQSKCPNDLLLQEHHTFGHLRTGPRIRWLNIARELREQSLNHSKEDVGLLIMQTIWQAGPAELDYGFRRDSHFLLHSMGICQDILAEVDRLLDDVCENWSATVTTHSLIIITTRIFDLGPEDIKPIASRVLKKARTVTHEWTRELGERLGRSAGDERQGISRILFRAASLCCATFDVDDKHVHLVLQDDADILPAIECAIITHDCSSLIELGASSTFERHLMDTNRRIYYTLERPLRDWIVAGKRYEGIDSCIKYAWNDFGRSSTAIWNACKGINSRWITTKSGLCGNQREVFLNLLTGQLLIDGTPLKRLPEKYSHHPLYIRTFGDSVFDVSPGHRNMDFQTRHRIEGFLIYFRMLPKDTLIIQAEKNGEYFELIPHECFKDDLPLRLVEDYAHWFCQTSGTIEFRLKTHPWTQSDTLPTLSMSSRKLSDLQRRFIDPSSTTAQKLYLALQSLERETNIEIFIPVQNDNFSVEVYLPRLKLGFYVNRDNPTHIYSHQFNDMIIDLNQDISTFVGLKNKLVLRPALNMDMHRAKVLVPFGDVKFTLFEKNHVEISIETPDNSVIEYHAYDIDIHLQRLVGTGLESLTSRLYRAYLHAITSHCLPDPLLGKTGVEEAISILTHAATWSFYCLSNAERKLLSLIKDLAPKRTFYPENRRSMQIAHWNVELQTWTQQDEFLLLTQEILQHNAKFQIFRDKDVDKMIRDESSLQMTLSKRAAYRRAVFLQAEYGGMRIGEGNDCLYESRSLLSPNSTIEQNICAVSRCTASWEVPNGVMTDLWSRYKLWGDSIGDPEKQGPSQLKLLYNRNLLGVSLAKLWLSLYNTCSNVTFEGRYGLIFLLATVIKSKEGKAMSEVWTLVAFAVSGSFSDPERFKLPANPRPYELNLGMEFNKAQIDDMIRPWKIQKTKARKHLKPIYITELEEQISRFISYLEAQMGSLAPILPPKRGYSLIMLSRKSMKEIETGVHERFKLWDFNSQLYRHTSTVQDQLSKIQFSGTRQPLVQYSFPGVCGSEKVHPPLRLADLRLADSRITDRFMPRYCSHPDPQNYPQLEFPTGHTTVSPITAHKLNELIRGLKTDATTSFDFQYINDLENSCAQYCTLKSENFIADSEKSETEDNSRSLVAQCLKAYTYALRDLVDDVCHPTHPPCSSIRQILSNGSLWPRCTPSTLLGIMSSRSQLRQRGRPRSEDATSLLRRVVDVAEKLARYQQTIRLCTYASTGMWEGFLKEAKNQGCANWEPIKHPDWLLLEIENHFTIRKLQSTMALRMELDEGSSQVLQLNMGEGKSSVVIPMISADLANGEQLVRIVVLKPLATQMFHLLVQRLGGLINRRVYQLPFNRNIHADLTVAKSIENLLQECQDEGGIWLCQPEQILSFQLMGWEKMLNKSSAEVGRSLLRMYRKLDESVRDVIDESDEVFDVKYQLIYAIGNEAGFHHAPSRWIVIQDFLTLLSDNLAWLENKHPRGVEVIRRGDGVFPTVRILHKHAAEDLKTKLADDIIRDKMGGTTYRLLTQSLRSVIYEFLTDREMESDKASPLFVQPDDEADKSRIHTLLLLRGLLAHGVLASGLMEKRWRVNYGIDININRVPPSNLAVPFRAKDSPAPRAEFSHPDMTIILTCLSYYYSGLSDCQMGTAFTALLKSGNPPEEYEKWISGDPSIPSHMCTLSGINFEDSHNIRTLVYSRLRKQKTVIDFYLKHIVFPREARNFEQKLSASGWDIARPRKYPLTGFSGTNDGRFTLPLEVTQKELNENLGTNAHVLDILLRPENNYYEYIPAEENKLETLLQHISSQQPPIRVIIDVGAQILLENAEVANRLLEEARRDHTGMSPEAVVYFENDNLVVQSVDGTTENLLFSPYARQLDKCFVYLDEAHTRGTDLKLPPKSRAAVTLGPKLTKDRLVQACMRMRQLGKSHSVMFFASGEVHEKIAAQANRRNSARIESLDVVRWTIDETREHIEKSIPLWASQGLSYVKRHKADTLHRSETHREFRFFSSDDADRECLDRLVEPESHTLEEMYGYSRTTCHMQSEATQDKTLQAIRKKCNDFGVGESSISDAWLLEEQEREISLDTERQHCIERPQAAKPADHEISRLAQLFVEYGMPITSAGETVYRTAMSSLFPTSARKYLIEGWNENLMVTTDFVRTVESNEPHIMKDYIRPVNWILRSRTHRTWLLISPYEANELLPEILKSQLVSLHIYASRTRGGQKSFGDLQYCVINKETTEGRNSRILSLSDLFPNENYSTENLLREVNLFAGSTHLDSYEEYHKVCEYLGLYIDETATINSDNDAAVTFADTLGAGFLSPNKWEQLGVSRNIISPFTTSPVMMLKELIKMRMKGQGAEHSHMGKILEGHLLREKDFEN